MNFRYFGHSQYIRQPAFNHYRPEYPPIDPSQFQSSLSLYSELIQDAEKIILYFKNSEQASRRLMEAAKQSDSEQARKIIQQSGISHPITVNFTPNQLIITLLSNHSTPGHCCELKMVVFW